MRRKAQDFLAKPQNNRSWLRSIRSSAGFSKQARQIHRTPSIKPTCWRWRVGNGRQERR